MARKMAEQRGIISKRRQDWTGGQNVWWRIIVMRQPLILRTISTLGGALYSEHFV